MPTNLTSTSGEIPLSLPPVAGDITFEDFLDLVADGEKADLLEGVIHMASPDNTVAAELTGWLFSILTLYVSHHRLGKVYVSRVAYRIGSRRGPEPDIGFVSKERESLRRRGYIDGPPDLAVEVVSPDSIDRDYVVKRALYEEASVQEYWILDPDHRRATFLRLRDGKFTEVTPSNHIFRSEVLAGFELDIRWVIGTDRPEATEIVRKFLT